MPTLAPAPRPEQPAAPVPIRHGSARLMLCINGDVYKLRRHPALVRGGKVWALTKATGDRTGSLYAVARSNGAITCSCPDHSQTQAECKHIRALVAVGLLARSSSSPVLKARVRKGGQS